MLPGLDLPRASSKMLIKSSTLSKVQRISLILHMQNRCGKEKHLNEGGPGSLPRTEPCLHGLSPPL